MALYKFRIIIIIIIRSGPPEFQLGGLGRAVSSLNGVRGEAPTETEFGAFRLKISEMVATILMILLRIKWSNFVQFSVPLDVLRSGRAVVITSENTLLKQPLTKRRRYF